MIDVGEGGGCPDAARADRDGDQFRVPGKRRNRRDVVRFQAEARIAVH